MTTSSPDNQVAARPLRAWQRSALRKYLMSNPKDFLAVATPGAGKTTFALRVAAELLSARIVDSVTIVAPTEHLKHQWAASAAQVGIRINPEFSNSATGLSSDYHGAAVTYAQVASHPFRHRSLTVKQRTLVILDEIHHGGDAKTWGDAIREAYGEAERRLALTGTPFRSDDSPIPFVDYEEDGQGYKHSKADHNYGYSDALKDGVVRPVVFLAYSGQASWKTNAGEEFTARLGEPLSAEHTARAWRTALDPHGEWMPAVLTAAHRRLIALREKGIADAGGLVIASDQDSARSYAALLKEISGMEAVVVLSDDPKASSYIESFRTGDQLWMVAVRMVSEGVDVPRLCVGVYATSASTPLFFAQAIGRFVRSRRPGETASVFVPSVPVLLQLASELEQQRDHVLGNPHREDDEEAQAQSQQTESASNSEEKGFISVGAEAELDHLIFDGASYGSAVPAASAEEEEYLGIPGLLDATQVKELLKQRQQKTIDTHSASHSSVPQEQPTTAADIDRTKSLRRELNALVAVFARRQGKPHGTIHNQLRKICGGPPVPMATAEQLHARIAELRTW